MNILCLSCDNEMDNYDEDDWICTKCNVKVRLTK